MKISRIERPIPDATENQCTDTFYLRRPPDGRVEGRPMLGGLLLGGLTLGGLLLGGLTLGGLCPGGLWPGSLEGRSL